MFLNSIAQLKRQHTNAHEYYDDELSSENAPKNKNLDHLLKQHTQNF